MYIVEQEGTSKPFIHIAQFFDENDTERIFGSLNEIDGQILIFVIHPFMRCGSISISRLAYCQIRSNFG